MNSEEIRFERRVLVQEQTAELGRALRGDKETAGIRAAIAENVKTLIEDETEGIADEMTTWFEERCCFGINDLINLLHPEFTPFLDLYHSEHPQDAEQTKANMYFALLKPREDKLVAALRPRLKRAIDEQVAEILAGQVAS